MLTRYLPQLGENEIGTWFIDRENDGIPKRLIQIPFVNYSVMVHCFIEDVYAFNDDDKDFGLNHSYDIWEQNGGLNL